MRISDWSSDVCSSDLFLSGLAGYGLMACDPMDDTYKEYLDGGERVYTGRVDSVETFAGYKRVGLSWLLISDPKITYCKIVWNNGADSIRIPVTRSNGIDTIRTVVDTKNGRASYRERECQNV